MTTAAPATARITGWDRAAIIALGGAGCALSYDALQQMAVAIHVRGHLTYLFPLVIDGFIAYGVRALLVLRAAALRARLYVWILFGAATASSIWANALHAVRLNEQTAQSGLRLGDTVVAVLSTLAPLALAGAVHLYILIAREVTEVNTAGHLGQVGQATARVSVTRTASAGRAEPTAGQVTPGQPAAALAKATEIAADLGQVTSGRSGQPRKSGQDSQETARVTTAGRYRAASVRATADSTLSAGQALDQAGHSVTEPVTDSPVGDLVTEPAGQPVAQGRPRPVTPPVSDRDGDPVTDRLLPIARKAANDHGKATRKIVAEAIRGRNIPLASDDLTRLMQKLREELAAAAEDRATP